ncbi:hypothetical protein DVH05_027271, partial [Phytophthora capsici]
MARSRKQVPEQLSYKRVSHSFGDGSLRANERPLRSFDNVPALSVSALLRHDINTRISSNTVEG